MGLFNNFPYLNMHEMNLNWLIQQTKKNTEEIAGLTDIAEPMCLLLDAGSLTDDTLTDVVVTGNVTPVEVFQKMGANETPADLCIKVFANNRITTCGNVNITRGTTKNTIYILAECIQYIDAETANIIHVTVLGSALGWTGSVIQNP